MRLPDLFRKRSLSASAQHPEGRPDAEPGVLQQAEPPSPSRHDFWGVMSHLGKDKKEHETASPERNPQGIAPSETRA